MCSCWIQWRNRNSTVLIPWRTQQIHYLLDSSKIFQSFAYTFLHQPIANTKKIQLTPVKLKPHTPFKYISNASTSRINRKLANSKVNGSNETRNLERFHLDSPTVYRCFDLFVRLQNVQCIFVITFGFWEDGRVFIRRVRIILIFSF